VSDRWRDALRGLDDVDPDDAVYRRAAQGPSHPGVPDGPSPRKRIVAGITAFAVFALAAGFAWQALRPSNGMTPAQPPPSPGSLVPLGADGSTLWPEMTAAEISDAQARADAGELPWRLDPKEVATRFASEVLGWDASSYEINMTSSTIQHANVIAMTARLTRYALPCPSPPPGQPMAAFCAGGAEDLFLGQPGTSGDGGIWSVVSVSAPDASVDASAGQVISNGGSVMAHLDVFDGLNGAAGFKDCGGASAQDVTGQNTSIGVQAASPCPSPAGFVWIASSPDPLNGSVLYDPMNGDAAFVAFAAVPIVVSLENVSPGTPTPTGTSTYTDPAGWTVTFPSAWAARSIEVQDKVSTHGVSISNVDEGLASPNAATPGPIGPDMASAPSDVVALSIITISGGPPPGTPSDDTPLPLSASDLQVAPGTCTVCPASMGFRSNGVQYEIDLWAGPDASQSDVTAARAIIDSFRGASLKPGTITEGWTPFFEPNGGFSVGQATAVVLSGTPELKRFGVGYLMRPTGDLPMYALDLVPDTCGEGQDQRWDPATQQIRVTCPDGTVIAYDAEGRPDPGNPPAFDRRLDAYPVIRAWDGQFLTAVSGGYFVQPRWDPHPSDIASTTPSP
jgi:hypothetical protein